LPKKSVSFVKKILTKIELAEGYRDREKSNRAAYFHKRPNSSFLAGRFFKNMPRLG